MECKKQNSYLILAILLLILLINILSLFKKDSALELETLKVGGVENMELVKQLYQSADYIQQQTTAIEQALAQINMAVQDNLNDNSDQNTLEGNESLIQELERIKSSGVVYGDENARFTIVEYSELLCPFCKRHSDQGTIDAVIENYPNEVNTVFRSFIVHPEAAKLSEVVECVGELKRDSHHKFIKNSFAYEGGLSVEILVDIAGKLGINKNDLQECIDSGKYTQEINNQTNEGRTLFGVSGTPGNVIIDKETGKFVLIPGAYPAEKFIEEIEKLKNN